MLGAFLRDVIVANRDNFCSFGPDETASNRLGDVFAVTSRRWQAEVEATDEGLGADGRVMEILSEHMCQGWLEGYLLTGRHGLFNCYEAFIHIVDSMFNQHAKWLKVTRRIPWRRPIASLNYLLSSHVWRQDHNGFSHQDPGFIDHVVNKKAEIIRVYLPPDANTLLSVADHCLRSRNYVNVIVAGKQPALQFLSMEDAVLHCTRGIGIWEWASNDNGAEPDVVLGCCGDVPTLETVAAAAILRERLPDIRVRVVNVVDLMRLQPETEHPHGLSDREFDSLFTTNRPIVFAYHGYPWLIHRLTYRRKNHDNLHVRGYKEEGTTTTPFDMVMLNDLDRFHLVIDVIDRLPQLVGKADHLRQEMVDSASASPRVRSRARGGSTGDPRLDLARLSRAVGAILVVNAGSTSLKLHAVEADQKSILVDSFAEVPEGIDAVAHRVVHGGPRFRDPVVIDDEVRDQISELVALAPLHNAPALEAIDVAQLIASACTARCGLRHVVSSHDPGRSCRVRSTAGLARAMGHSPVRISGPLGRVVRTACPELLGYPVARLGRLSSRWRILCHRRSRGPLCRYDDGLHAARGCSDDDALGINRSWCTPLRASRGISRRRLARSRAQLRLRCQRTRR